MALIDRFLARARQARQLTVHHADGTTKQLRHARSRLSRRHDPLHRQGRGRRDRPQSRRSARRRRSWTGGWSIEQGDIRDLVNLLTAQQTVGSGRARAEAASAARRGRRGRRTGSTGSTWRARSKQNVAHHYDLSATGSTTSSSTPTANIAAPISPIPANSLEQAQDDKKAHIAAKLALKPGHARARHRLRLGRDGAVPAREDRRRGARRHAVRGAAQGRAPRAPRRPASPTR